VEKFANIMIFVNLCKELIELRVRYGEPRPPKRFLQLSLVQLAIVVSVDGMEEGQELSVRVFDKGAKF
jgi:hypothetical protein